MLAVRCSRWTGSVMITPSLAMARGLIVGYVVCTSVRACGRSCIYRQAVCGNLAAMCVVIAGYGSHSTHPMPSPVGSRARGDMACMARPCVSIRATGVLPVMPVRSTLIISGAHGGSGTLTRLVNVNARTSDRTSITYLLHPCVLIPLGAVSACGLFLDPTGRVSLRLIRLVART